MSVFARFAALGVVAAVLVPVGSAAGSPRAEVTCFGRAPTLIGSDGADTLTGTADSEVIVGLDGDDTIDGGGGDDLICAGAGNDTVHGGAGADRISGQGGKDSLFGDGGKDRLVGGGGKDSLVGGSQRDLTVGGGGIDRCDGEVARACEGAGSGKLTNPPLVTMYFDEGVGVDDREAITAGVGIAHHYLATILGGDEAATWTDWDGNSLTVTVHASEDMGCCVSGSFIPTRPFPDDFLLGPVFNVGILEWTGSKDAPQSVLHRKHSAHEYAHAWQGSNGCLGGGHGDPLGRWLSEGMAEYIAWSSLVEAGVITEEQALGWTVRAASANPLDADLAAWESNDDQSFEWQAYYYAFLAAIRLVNEYGGPTVLRDLCEETARLSHASGFPYWPSMAVAFENLGIDRGAFYAEMAGFFDQVVALHVTFVSPSNWDVPDSILQFLLEPST